MVENQERVQECLTSAYCRTVFPMRSKSAENVGVKQQQDYR